MLRDSVTENITITPGVNITAWSGSTLNTPSITGKITMTGAGTSTISGVKLVTNSDNFLVVSGSAASVINLNDCFLNCQNNTGISFSSSSASAKINIVNCKGDLATTGITIFANSSAGVMSLRYTDLTNTGSSVTASTISAGQVDIEYCILPMPITTSSTGLLTANFIIINLQSLNTTCLTIGGSVSSVVTNSFLASGTASTVSISVADFGLSSTLIGSSNTNAITGSGRITYSALRFTGSSNTMNTTTQVANVVRNGISLSAHQPAFLAYLPSTDLNKTGAGASFTIGSATALTEVFDQGANFVTTGTFTAPYTGKYFLQGGTYLTGCTINSTNQTSLVTSNRTYVGTVTRAPAANDNSANCSAVADMDAADTFTVTVVGAGEAGNTNDVFGNASCNTFMSGFLLS
jgi:hypothetical protein